LGPSAAGSAVSPQAAGFVLKFIEKSSFACG